MDIKAGKKKDIPKIQEEKNEECKLITEETFKSDDNTLNLE